jgi:hypothetical protein
MQKHGYLVLKNAETPVPNGQKIPKDFNNKKKALKAPFLFQL